MLSKAQGGTVAIEEGEEKGNWSGVRLRGGEMSLSDVSIESTASAAPLGHIAGPDNEHDSLGAGTYRVAATDSRVTSWLSTRS